MLELGIDIETYSDIDINDCGVFRYTESPNFKILIICYCVNGDESKIYVYGDDSNTDQQFLEALTDPTIIKTAHNAPFEIACLSAWFKIELCALQWRCTMALASMCGYPLGLGAVGKALELDSEKDSKGKALIKYFCVPCKPTEKNGFRTRNVPISNPAKFMQVYGRDADKTTLKKLEIYVAEVNEKWDLFINYCIQDVIQEQKVKKRLSFYKVSEFERRLYFLDQIINETGIRVDQKLVRNAIKMEMANREILIKEITEITGLQNPNSGAQLKQWISEETGDNITSLTKETREELLKQNYPSHVHRALEINSEISKTSVTKYLKMIAAVCKDGTLKGMLQYYGAGTGRWAGRIIQPHNLPRISFKQYILDIARNIVLDGDLEYLSFMFGNIPGTLSQLIRTALIPSKRSRLIIADYSAIEARVIAWLAGERWRLDIFKRNGDIYLASAEMMFNLPAGSLKKEDPRRQQGKVAELALGFQGGAGALQIMDTQNVIPWDRYEPIKVAWRKASPSIVRYWYGVQAAAIEAVQSGTKTRYGAVKFYTANDHLFIELPSGRKLCYPHPSIRADYMDRDSLFFKGVDAKTRQFKNISLYGGLITENIVQAVARDVLANAMMNLHLAGYNVVLHVHDEVVCDEPWTGNGTAEEMGAIMGAEIPWAKGLPLHAEAYESNYYKKD